MRFLGGAEQARSRIGRWPDNWQVAPFTDDGVATFLADLDVLIHHPHPRYVEECGRVVLEAMAAGLPVILPPVYRENFGEAAVYAEPPQVWENVQELWCSESRFLAQIETGYAFIEAHCTYEHGVQRISRLRLSHRPRS